MSHGKLRTNKDCLNCGHIVEERFCPHCGQENIENKQSFHYLFTHFIEDFTHYDGQFWKTIKLLLFKPGELSKVYLEGKRQLYVPPVKLYIFISFLTFFLSAILPSDNLTDSEMVSQNKEQVEKEKISAKEALRTIKKENFISKDKSLDVINKIPTEALDSTNNMVLTTNLSTFNLSGLNNLEDFDSKYNSSTSKVFRPFVKKYFHLKEQGFSHSEISEKFSDTFMHSLPKALFIYLPLFAFMMWLFHNKKKWLYYDHGIFTLHYFSFILTTILILNILDSVEDFADSNAITIIYGLFTLLSVFYIVYYFFSSHKKIYGYKKSTTLFKGVCLFIVNSISLLLLLIGLFAISFLMIH